MCHGSDLPAIWRPYASIGANFTAGEEAMAIGMEQYWANFAATGDPNKGAFPPAVAWPAYTAAARQTLAIDATSDAASFVVTPGWRAPTCAWWDISVGYSVY